MKGTRLLTVAMVLIYGTTLIPANVPTTATFPRTEGIPASFEASPREQPGMVWIESAGVVNNYQASKLTASEVRFIHEAAMVAKEYLQKP